LTVTINIMSDRPSEKQGKSDRPSHPQIKSDRPSNPHSKGDRPSLSCSKGDRPSDYSISAIAPPIRITKAIADILRSSGTNNATD